jgi:hypothetical protein
VSQHALRKRITVHGATKRDWGDARAREQAEARERMQAERAAAEAVRAEALFAPSEEEANETAEVLAETAMRASARAMRGRMWDEAKALALREAQPQGEVMSIPEPAAAVELPMERPLHTPPLKPLIADLALAAGDAEVDAAVLYAQLVVDRAQLARHIRQTLQDRAQVSLRELTDAQPLRQGLAELLSYLQLGSEAFKTVVDEKVTEVIAWESLRADGLPIGRAARLPRILFVR